MPECLEDPETDTASQESPVYRVVCTRRDDGKYSLSYGRGQHKVNLLVAHESGLQTGFHFVDAPPELGERKGSTLRALKSFFGRWASDEFDRRMGRIKGPTCPDCSRPLADDATRCDVCNWTMPSASRTTAASDTRPTREQIERERPQKATRTELFYSDSISLRRLVGLYGHDLLIKQLEAWREIAGTGGPHV